MVPSPKNVSRETFFGGSAFIVVAALMLWDMHRREKAGTLSIPQAGLPDNPYLTRSAQ